MQKRKLGNLEASAIRLRPASARQVSAFELNSPKHLRPGVKWRSSLLTLGD